jgi:hypothetical protein
MKLEILTSADDASMALTIGAHSTVDLERYQRALDALAQVTHQEGSTSEPGAPQQQQ